MKGRWTVLAVAAGATLVAAAVAGAVLDRLASAGPGAELRLQNISQATLGRMGLTLTTAQAPAYCGLSDAISDHGWKRGGVADCPISKQAAERAASRSTAQVLESALARATMPQNRDVGENRLVWAVVVRQSFGRGTVGGGFSCASPRPGTARQTWTGCVGGVLPFISRPALTLVDAQTGAVLLANSGFTGLRPPPLPPVAPLPIAAPARTTG